MPSPANVIDPDQTLWKEADGAVTVLKLATGEFFELNPLGSAVWIALSQGLSPDALVKELAPGYDVSKHQFAADVSIFLAQMATRGLLRLDPVETP